MSRRGWWLFAAMSVIWGIPYLLIKVADGGVAPPVLVLARVTIGAALLLPIAIRRRELAPLLPHWRWLALFALVEIIAPWLLLSDAETRLSSSLSGLLIASVPILVAVFSRLTGGQDRLTMVRWSGLLIGLAGVALLVAGGGTHGDAGSVGEVLLVAVCYATGPLIISRRLSELPSLGMTAACLAFAAVVYAPIAALTWPAAVPAGKVLAALARSGRDLHGGCVHRLLRADRRGGPGQGVGHHLRQSRGRRGARHRDPRRAADRGHGRCICAHSERFGAGDQDRPATGAGARPRVPGPADTAASGYRAAPQGSRD